LLDLNHLINPDLNVSSKYNPIAIFFQWMSLWLFAVLLHNFL